MVLERVLFRCWQAELVSSYEKLQSIRDVALKALKGPGAGGGVVCCSAPGKSNEKNGSDSLPGPGGPSSKSVLLFGQQTESSVQILLAYAKAVHTLERRRSQQEEKERNRGRSLHKRLHQQQLFSQENEKKGDPKEQQAQLQEQERRSSSKEKKCENAKTKNTPFEGRHVVFCRVREAFLQAIGAAESLLNSQATVSDSVGRNHYNEGGRVPGVSSSLPNTLSSGAGGKDLFVSQPSCHHCSSTIKTPQIVSPPLSPRRQQQSQQISSSCSPSLPASQQKPPLLQGAHCVSSSSPAASSSSPTYSPQQKGTTTAGGGGALPTGEARSPVLACLRSPKHKSPPLSTAGQLAGTASSPSSSSQPPSTTTITRRGSYSLSPLLTPRQSSAPVPAVSSSFSSPISASSHQQNPIPSSPSATGGGVSSLLSPQRDLATTGGVSSPRCSVSSPSLGGLLTPPHPHQPAQVSAITTASASITSGGGGGASLYSSKSVASTCLFQGLLEQVQVEREYLEMCMEGGETARVSEQGEEQRLRLLDLLRRLQTDYPSEKPMWRVAWGLLRAMLIAEKQQRDRVEEKERSTNAGEGEELKEQEKKEKENTLTTEFASHWFSSAMNALSTDVPDDDEDAALLVSLDDQGGSSQLTN